MGPNQKILDYIIICSNINKENMVFIDELSNSEVDISELIKFSYKYGEIDKCLEKLSLIAQRLSKFKKSNQVWISKEITIYIKAMLNYIRNNDKHKVKYLLDSVYKKCIKKDNICKLRVIQEFHIFYIDNKRYKCEVCKSFNSDDKILLVDDRNNVLIKDVLGILFKNGKAKVYKKDEQISNKDLLDMELGILYNNSIIERYYMLKLMELKRLRED